MDPARVHLRSGSGIRQLPATLSALVVVNAVAGILAALAGVAVIVDVGRDPAGLGIGSALLCLGVAGCACSVLIARRRPSGRRLQIGLALAGLAFLPFWTLSALWALVVMFRHGERALLSGRREEEGTPPEADPVPPSPPGRDNVRAALITVGLLCLGGLEVAFLTALPSLATGERMRQKRTMSEMRTAMTAIESYAVEHGSYPPTISTDDLARLLEPVHVRVLPRVDAWGHPLRYESWTERAESPRPDSYVLASPGKDGAWEADVRTVATGPTRSASADIVIRNAEFVRFPEGTQTAAGR